MQIKSLLFRTTIEGLWASLVSSALVESACKQYLAANTHEEILHTVHPAYKNICEKFYFYHHS